MTNAHTKPIDNSEFIYLLDNLKNNNFFGKVTFFFQGGKIEACEKYEKKSKSELRNELEKDKTRAEPEGKWLGNGNKKLVIKRHKEAAYG